MLYGSLWDPEDEVKKNVGAYVDEVKTPHYQLYSTLTDGFVQVARVLAPGGKWLYITYRQPHFMKPLLVREETWALQVESLEAAPGMFEYFGFVMIKKQ